MHLTQIPVHVDSYDSDWPRRFETEKRLIVGLQLAKLEIEHFGSTSVPGLASKPTVDLLVGTFQELNLNSIDNGFSKIGYEFYKSPNSEWRVYLKPYGDSIRGYHLHLVPFQSEHWKRHLRFRDLLRANPKLVDEYASLKRRLVKESGQNRSLYQSGKAEFINRVLRESTEAT